MRNLLTKVPKSAQSFVATMVRTIFAQPDAQTVHEQHRRIIDQLEQRFPDAAALLDAATPDLLAFTAFPKEHWRQLWSNNSLERLNKEIRRRTDVVGIFPRPRLDRPPGRRRPRRTKRRMGGRRTPLHERRVDRESTHRPRTRAGRRRARAPRRRLNARLRDDRREIRGHRSRSEALRAPGATDPSPESDRCHGEGGAANPDNSLNVKRG
jgi:hypothetical protein